MKTCMKAWPQRGEVSLVLPWLSGIRPSFAALFIIIQPSSEVVMASSFYHLPWWRLTLVVYQMLRDFKTSDPTFLPRNCLRSSGCRLALGARNLHLPHGHHHVCVVAPKWSSGDASGDPPTSTTRVMLGKVEQAPHNCPGSKGSVIHINTNHEVESKI